jgi:tetratricopeptide (TPR) repeat protein
MNQRLAAAQAALNSGRAADAIENLAAAIEADPAQSVGVYRTLLVQLYHAGRYAEGERWGAAGIERFPRDFELWNTLGVLRRRLKRLPEAMLALEAAAKLNPANPAAQVNRGNVLMDMREFVRAENRSSPSSFARSLAAPSTNANSDGLCSARANAMRLSCAFVWRSLFARTPSTPGST